MFLVVVTARDDFVEQMCLNRCMDRLQEVRLSHKNYMKNVPRGESSFNRGEEKGTNDSPNLKNKHSLSRD